jgi:hypothetical protein
MLTDNSPKKSLKSFRESDRYLIPLPPDSRLVITAGAIESAMKDGGSLDVQRACSRLSGAASVFYGVPECTVGFLLVSEGRRTSLDEVHLKRALHDLPRERREIQRSSFGEGIAKFGSRWKMRALRHRQNSEGRGVELARRLELNSASSALAHLALSIDCVGSGDLNAITNDLRA